MDYPIWWNALGGPLLMALVAVTHVIVSHFAVGGGIVIAVTETLAVRRGDPEMRDLAKRSSLMLILVSTVFGAISGVGIWVTAGLIAPAAISSLIHTYVWAWAMEWVFFVLEIVAALIYYATWDRISKAAHLMVGWLYVVGAYMSLVIINGIITFMLTPGGWLADHQFWSGFFNPTYWPALVLRTGIVLMMAVAFMVFPAMRAAAEARPRLVRFLGWWMAAGVLIAYGGYRWWEAALPAEVRGLFLGSSASLHMLAVTRHVVLWALAVTLLMAVVLLLALPRATRVVPAVVLMLAAFTAFAGYERLREGCRKPFLIHDYMFSNGLLVDRIANVNRKGVLATARFAARVPTTDPVARGSQVFRAECASCHTLNGYLSIRGKLPTFAEVLAVAGDDPPGSGEKVYREECVSCHADMSFAEAKESLPSAVEIREDPETIDDLVAGMISGVVDDLKESGTAYTSLQDGQRVDMSKLKYPFMPPLVGTDAEVDALVQYLGSLASGPGRSADEGGAR